MSKDKVLEKLNQKYSKFGLDTAKLSDEKTAYTLHVKSGDLHGLFISAGTMAILKSVLVDYLLPIGDEFENFVAPDPGPLTYMGTTKYLRKWLDECALERQEGLACRHVTNEEHDAMQRVSLLGATFIPADQSYEIGWTLLHILHRLNGLEQLGQMFRLPENPNEWFESEVKENGPKKTFGGFAKQTKIGLDKLIDIFPGYYTFITKNCTFLAKLLPKEKANKVIYVLGDCNPEFPAHIHRSYVKCTEALNSTNSINIELADDE